MAVTYSNSAASSAIGTTVSFAYTAGTTTPALSVTTKRFDPNSLTSITYNGVALTSLYSSGDDNHNAKGNLSTGSNTLTFTWAGYTGFMYSIISVDGADTTTPFGTAATASGSSAAPSTGSVTCPPSGLVIGHEHSAYTTSPAPTTSAGTLGSSFRSGGGGHTAANGYRATTGAVSWTLGSSTAWIAYSLPVNAAGGGTTYNQSISGSITGSGIVIRSVTFGKGVAGSLSANGTVNKRISRGLSGAVTGSGSPFKASSKQVQGSVTGVGILSASTGAEMSIAGSITATGAVARAVQYVRSYSAAITMAGTVAKRTLKSFSGTIQAIGTMGKGMFVSLAGSITASGILSSLKFTPTVGTFVTSSLRSIRRFIGRR